MDEIHFNESLREVNDHYGPYFSYSFDHAGNIQPHDNFGLFFNRLLAMAHDIFPDVPLKKIRILDLGSYEGIFSLGFAKLGAHVVSVEGRETGAMKLKFAADAMKLKNLETIHADVRTITKEHYGQFDLVLACGIMYHLDTDSVFAVARNVSDMTKRAAIIDTHIALSRPIRYVYGDQEYWGKSHTEFDQGTSPEEKTYMLAKSLDNEKSFWLTRISWLNLLSNLGFGTVYECLAPFIHGEKGFYDRMTMVALKPLQSNDFFPTPAIPISLFEQIGRPICHCQEEGIFPNEQGVVIR